jgi:ppGpp synthetase/RelA/SpoT-type nucleotidyltranferase
MADPIDTFVNAWPHASCFWDVLTEAAYARCKEGLEEKFRLKFLIICRTKAQDSLRGRVERRQTKRLAKNKGLYKTQDEIVNDMIDLSGVRIILTFPDDIKGVKDFLTQEFGEDVISCFWGLDDSGKTVELKEKTRFIGYRVTHLRVKWNTPEHPQAPHEHEDQ